jgi:hypothetical protein
MSKNGTFIQPITLQLDDCRSFLYSELSIHEGFISLWFTNDAICLNCAKIKKLHVDPFLWPKHFHRYFPLLQSNQLWKFVHFLTSNNIFREKSRSSQHQDLYKVSCSSSKSIGEYFTWLIDLILFYQHISTLEINIVI